MKKIIFIIIIAAAAVAVIAWLQAQPMQTPAASVTNGAPDFVKEAQGVDIGNPDEGFQAVDADIMQL